MTIRNRLEVLEQAKSAALSGDYAEALHMVDLVLRNDPDDTEALCFKGNTLELMVFSEQQETRPIRAASYDQRLIDARQCYEKAVSIDPGSTRALRDLADHLKGIGDKKAALKLYDRVIGLLSDRPASGEPVSDELEETRKERDELL